MRHDLAVIDSAKVIENRTLREENTDLEERLIEVKEALKDARFQIAEQLGEIATLHARVRVLEQREQDALQREHNARYQQMSSMLQAQTLQQSSAAQAAMQQQAMYSALNAYAPGQSPEDIQQRAMYQGLLDHPFPDGWNCTCVPDRASALSRHESYRHESMLESIGRMMGLK
jgi:hypothetical protein